MLHEKQEKKGQVTIFIILAFVLVIFILILFFAKGRIPVIFQEKVPIDQIETCVLESSKASVELLSLQGGTLNPENYYMYKGNKVDYVCYTEESYKPCVMQKPLLINTVEFELAEVITEKSKECLNLIKNDFTGKGYSITYKNPKVTTEILPGTILIEIEADLKVSDSDSSITYKTIKIAQDSSLYKFLQVVSTIANKETTDGDSEALTIMLLDHQLKVEKRIQSEGTRIYTLTDRGNNEKFMFAARSIVIPPGLIELDKFKR